MSGGDDERSPAERFFGRRRAGRTGDLPDGDRLARVATTGSYNDLADKPEIPDAVAIDASLTQAGAAADARATGEALAGKASAEQGAKADTALQEHQQLVPVYSDTPTYSEWVFSGDGVRPGSTYAIEEETKTDVASEYSLLADNVIVSVISETPSASTTYQNLRFPAGITATRTRTDIVSYRLGTQTGKELQPKGNYASVAQVAAKQDTISDLATIRSGAARGATALQSDDRNLLVYGSGTTLSPEIACYRAALAADGSFPTIDAAAIPTAAAYFQFDLELTVPFTVPATITGPSGWAWVEGHEIPDPALLAGGDVICISVRLNCTARSFLASVWRVA